MSEQNLFTAVIDEAYPFRHVMGMLKQLFTEINIIFRKNGIFINESNTTGEVLILIEIRGSDLSHYSYDITDENDEDAGGLKVGVSMLDLSNFTKSIVKNNKLIMYMAPGDANLYLNIQNSKGDHPKICIVKPYELEYSEHSVYPYARADDNPNVRITAHQFSKICASVSSSRCKVLLIIGKPNGIIFKGIKADKTIAFIEPCGNIDNKTSTLESSLSGNKKESIGVEKIRSIKFNLVDPDIVCSINVTIDVVKAFGKINNLASSGIIKFWIEEKKPLRIEAHISTYGKISIYLRDAKF